MHRRHRLSLYGYLLGALYSCATGEATAADWNARTGRDLLVLCEVDYARCSEFVAWTISGIQVGILGTLGLQSGDTSMTNVMNNHAYRTLYGCRPSGLTLDEAAVIVIDELRRDASSSILGKLPAASILFALHEAFPCP